MFISKKKGVGGDVRFKLNTNCFYRVLLLTLSINPSSDEYFVGLLFYYFIFQN